ncbi:hypothetical protein ZJ62_08380 [Salmonella enterica subsp. enterica serovar Kentucky]|nr:hypothetical protein [Salmonella enterica subsp. enterica serovar Kentucky]
MNDELIFDVVFIERDYLTLPETVKAECVKVKRWWNGSEGSMIEGMDGTVGMFRQRGCCIAHPVDLSVVQLRAHKSQHPQRVSASGLRVLASGERLGDAWLYPTADALPQSMVNATNQIVGTVYSGEVHNTSRSNVPEVRVLPGWINHTVGTYYTKRLERVALFVGEGSDKLYQQRLVMLKRYYPRVIHPFGYAWVSEVQYNPRKQRLEAKVLNERWLPVMHPRVSVDIAQKMLEKSKLVCWDVTMLRHP